MSERDLKRVEVLSEVESGRRMSRRFSKVAVVLLLLLLLIGPVLQVLDCFNDAPNLDHDGVLHGVDALLCIAFTLLIFSGLLLAFLKLVRLTRHLPRQLVVSFCKPVPPVAIPALRHISYISPGTSRLERFILP